MKNNPYSLLFGKEPNQMISRQVQRDGLLEAFTRKVPPEQIFMITGIRGCGKTVFMTEVSRRIARNTNWIVVELNPERDMLHALVSKLSSENQLAALFQQAKVNLSFFGFGVEISGTKPITDLETALIKMLESLQRHKKKVLVTIDEVSNTGDMRTFAAAFQILIRRNLPIFLLMTGLYDNIHSLQNEKTLTFLYRAPKIELGPLNLSRIAKNYEQNLPVSTQESRRMAKLTRGYSFAFQVLGYFAYEQGGLTDEVLNSFQEYLEDYVYEKVWDELSAQDKRLVYGIARNPDGKVSEIRGSLDMDSNTFNQYRRRLIQKGIIEGDTYGYVHFLLPLFEEYVQQMYAE